MKFYKLSFAGADNFLEFIQFWSSLYNYPKENLYTNRIEKQKFTPEDIEKLFEWKNGSSLSQKKKESLKKIISKIHIINQLKLNFNIDTFLREFNEISAIWKIFLLHITVPQNYPIFDQHVYRAFYFLQNNQVKDIPSINATKEKIYFNEYEKFFNSLAHTHTEVNRKKIDEALWAFGKFIKTDYGKSVVLP